MGDGAPAPRLTAVRRERPGCAALEVDGRPWRVVPDEVVVRCGLAPGIALERPLLRSLRHELRSAEALGAASRAVARRDISAARLQQRLGERGIRPPAAATAVAALVSAGAVDDARLARVRARSLAERGWGDAAVAARLEREGIDAALVAAALAGLAPEAERAAGVAARARDRRSAWSLLVRRGFAAEAIEEALARWTEEAEAGYDTDSSA